jgi:hypothetical protein
VSLESRIDELYKLPPDEFVPARTALAKSLTGDEAKRVKALTKPTVVPWSVNQVYWHARDVYARVLKTGETLRDAQLTALKGRTSDVRAATTAHRQAIAEAVKAATNLASKSGAQPDPDLLARMLEAVSMQKTPPEPHGRFTRPLQPQGFEALAGIEIKAMSPSLRAVAAKEADAHAGAAQGRKPSAAEARALKKREQDAAEAARKRNAVLKEAETTLAHARTAETRARFEWEKTKKALEQAEQAVKDLRNQTGH